jgi:hypothetical protein
LKFGALFKVFTRAVGRSRDVPADPVARDDSPLGIGFVRLGGWIHPIRRPFPAESTLFAANPVHFALK